MSSRQTAIFFIIAVAAILFHFHSPPQIKATETAMTPMESADAPASAENAAAEATQLENLNAPVPAPQVKNNPAALAKFRQDIQVSAFEQIRSCVDQYDHCGIPDTNPYAIFDGVVNRIVARLQSVTAEYLALNDQDREQVQEPLGELAEWTLNFPDDNVREQGLALAENGLPPRERVRAVVASLEKSVSGPYFEEGLAVIKRAEPGALDRKTEDFLIATLNSGGVSDAEAVARHALSFITPENRERFVEAERQAPAESNIRLYLKTDIQEFDRSQSGG